MRNIPIYCGLYLLNTLYKVKGVFDHLYDTLYNGYCENTWVFTSRNAHPVLLNNRWKVDSSINLIYSPSTYSFQKNASYGKSSLDMLTAEIHTPNGFIFDMSSFLYLIKWYNVVPSLFELVVLFFMHEKVCLSTSMIDTYSLHILTSDGDDIIIPLSSKTAKEPFINWSSFSGELKVD